MLVIRGKWLALVGLLSCTNVAFAEDANCDVERGTRVFNKCITCHTFDGSGNHLVGPNLHGLDGRKAGSVEGFKASKWVRESGVTWNAETLDAFLLDPPAYIKRNRMAFAGLKKDEDRVAVICHVLGSD